MAVGDNKYGESGASPDSLVHLLSGECYSIFLNRQIAFSNMKLSNNRSVMPLDVLGDTRVTMKLTTCSPCPRGLGNHLASFLVGIVD